MRRWWNVKRFDVEAGYVSYRPRTGFMPFFVSDRSGEEAKMYTLGENFLANSTDKTFVERFGKNPAEFTAPTITLDDLLTSAQIERVDFLSMDIELSEPKALAGFDIERFRPDLVCIEAHPEVRQQIVDYFTATATSSSASIFAPTIRTCTSHR